MRKRAIAWCLALAIIGCDESSPAGVGPVATRLDFVAPPTTVQVGVPFDVSVVAQDGFGTSVTTTSGVVTLTIQSVPPGSLVSRDLKAMSAGTVRFTLNVSSAGSYRISASMQGLASGITDIVAVTP